jgi:hypothetical protein
MGGKFQALKRRASYLFRCGFMVSGRIFSYMRLQLHIDLFYPEIV